MHSQINDDSFGLYNTNYMLIQYLCDADHYFAYFEKKFVIMLPT